MKAEFIFKTLRNLKYSLYNHFKIILKYTWCFCMLVFAWNTVIFFCRCKFCIFIPKIYNFDGLSDFLWLILLLFLNFVYFIFFFQPTSIIANENGNANSYRGRFLISVLPTLNWCLRMAALWKISQGVQWFNLVFCR